MKKLLSLILTWALILGMIPGSYAAKSTLFKSVNDLSGYLYLQNGTHSEAYRLTSKGLYGIDRIMGTLNFVENKNSQIEQAPQLSKDKKTISFYIDRGEEFEYVFTYKFTKNMKGNVVLKVIQPNGESTAYTVKLLKNLKELTAVLKKDKYVLESYRQDLASAKRKFKSTAEIQGVWYSPNDDIGVLINKDKFTLLSRKLGSQTFNQSDYSFIIDDLSLNNEKDLISGNLTEENSIILSFSFSKGDNGKMLIDYDDVYNSPFTYYKSLEDLNKATAKDVKLIEKAKLESLNSASITIENIAGTWINSNGYTAAISIEGVVNGETMVMASPYTS